MECEVSEEKVMGYMIFTTAVPPLEEEVALSSINLCFNTSPWKAARSMNHMILNSGNN